MVKLMLENHDEVIIGLSNPFRVPTKTNDAKLSSALSTEGTRNPLNNPWPYWQRVLMIRWSLEDAGYDPGRVIIVPNLIASGFDERETLFPKEDTTMYTMPSGQHNKLILESDQNKGWDVVVIDPAGRTISGTKMREMLETDNPDWELCVPAGTAKVIKKYGLDIKL